MPGINTKLYKWKPTDGPLCRDDVSTWVFTVHSYAIQNGWSEFLPKGKESQWTATDDEEDKGLKVAGDDATNKNLKSDFKDFLTGVSANWPTGFTETVIRECTSFKWIEDKIKKTFNLTTTGDSFLDGLDLKFEFDVSFTHQQAWMVIKDQYTSSLLPANSKYMGND